MRPGTRWVLLTVLFVAFSVTVVVAGVRDGQPDDPAPLPGVERLGPESGEPVADYLRRAADSLPSPGSDPVWALVQLDHYPGPEAAAALVPGNARLAGVVLRVPLDGVQTALVFRDLPGQDPVTELSSALGAAAADRAEAAAHAPPDSRRAAAADTEATLLRDGCSCVLAMLVRADADTLGDLAARSGVRAVHAASPDTPRQNVAISPLLPEQDSVVGPVPDTGPLPR